MKHFSILFLTALLALVSGIAVDAQTADSQALPAEGFAVTAPAEAPITTDGPSSAAISTDVETADGEASLEQLRTDIFQAAGGPTEDCNQRTCGASQYCCNFSCSICAPIGGFCTQQVCD